MTILICFLIFVCIILLMSIGVIMKRKAIQGSCGGLSSIDVERVCNCETVCDEHAEHTLYQISEPSSDKSQS